MKYLVYCICLILGIQEAYAQKSELQGQLKGEEREALPGATVVLLDAKDSAMHSFTIADGEGNFKLRNVAFGNYLLQISFVGFQPISRRLSLNSTSDFIIPPIIMKTKDELLEDVEVAADRIPIQIKNDTIEYNAAAFKTQPNATVEELLKKLPGVDVEDDGTIKAQGETVNKVLVDGKEFFGDDPQIATKNLPADALDKVQVFDKLSDMAEFTGIDDGTRDKTINLSLKEDKKNGLFGNIKGGYGSSDTYNGKANVNQFTKTKQLSVIAAANNVNEQNFSLEDYINLSGGLGNLMSGGGTVELNVGEGLGSAMGMGNGGINDVWSGGLNYNKDIGKNTEVSINYFYNRLKNNLQKTSNRQNFSGEDIFFSNGALNDQSSYANHSLNTRVRHKINDQQDLTFRGTLKNTLQNIDVMESNETLNGSQLANEAQTINLSDGGNLELNSSLLYRKKFEKSGRSAAVRLAVNQTIFDQDADLDATSTFYNEQQIGSTETVRQDQLDDNSKLTWSGGFTYTEPLWKNKYVQFNYDYQNYQEDSQKDFYDIVNENQRIFNSELSSSYRTDYLYHKGGIRWMASTKKSNLTLSMQAQQSNLTGNSELFSEKITRTFFNWLPNARYSYRISTGNNFELGYRTSVREPGLNQLQPVVNNTNPLQIYNGNPNLKAEYRHNFSARYMLYDQFSFTSLFVSTNASYTNNKINNATAIDDEFRQIVTPRNVDNDLVWNSDVSFSTPVRLIKTKVSIGYNNVFNRSILFINEIDNNVNRSSNGFDFRLENRNKKVIDASVGSIFSWNATRYSENESLNQKYQTRTLFASLNLDLSKWNIGGDYRQITYLGEAFDDTESFPLVSASISRTVFKLDRGEIKLFVYDLLARNTGVNRNSDFNFIEDERVNVLGRYVMLSFSYKLSMFKA